MRFRYEDCMRSKLLDNLFVGPCPHNEQAVRQIAGLGVDAVMSLQTESDMAFYDIDWPGLIGGFSERGIQVHHYPVEDNVNAVRARLVEGVERLAKLLEDNSVYLHCIAGINRAPTLMAAYLVLKHGYSQAAAVGFIAARHHSSPYTAALEGLGEMREHYEPRR